MLTFYSYETKEKLCTWRNHFIAVPRQGELVEIDGKNYGVMFLLNTYSEIKIYVK